MDPQIEIFAVSVATSSIGSKPTPVSLMENWKLMDDRKRASDQNGINRPLLRQSHITGQGI